MSVVNMRELRAARLALNVQGRWRQTIFSSWLDALAVGQVKKSFRPTHQPPMRLCCANSAAVQNAAGTRCQVCKVPNSLVTPHGHQSKKEMREF